MVLGLIGIISVNSKKKF